MPATSPTDAKPGLTDPRGQRFTAAITAALLVKSPEVV
jgi:hypothetical protein